MTKTSNYPIYGLTDNYARWRILRYLVNYVNIPRVPLHGQLVELIFSFISPDVVARDYIRRFEIEADRTREIDGLINEIIRLWTSAETSNAIRRVTRKLLREELNATADAPETALHARIRELQEVHRLSDMETECAVFLYLNAADSMFANLLSCSRIFCNENAAGQVARLTQVGRLSRAAVLRAVSTRSALRRLGLVDEYLDLSAEVIGFLNGLNEEPLTSQFYRRDTGDVLPLAAHRAVSRHTALLQRLIRKHRGDQPLNILFYGSPGTGKTELARSLATATKRTLYVINHICADERRDTGSTFRYAALQACANSIDCAAGIILVDEADELLNGAQGYRWGHYGNREKGIVNNFMDASNAVCIWITNRANAIELSTRRRFDYSLEFPEFSMAQRLAVWQRRIRREGLSKRFKAGQIEQLARRYRISAGAIGLALRNYKRLAPANANPVNALDKILTQHLRLMEPDKRPELAAVADQYDLDCVTLKRGGSLPECVATLRDFSACLAADRRSGPAIRNYNVLLAGPPGTGKTEFVKYLAAELGRELVAKRASDLLSCWIGVTEEQVREAFEEAQADDAILFFDEIEGLLGDRRQAMRSWEITRVNELLVGMENFRGIFVAATNFRERVDAAAIRRFNLKLEFDYLNNDGKRRLFNRFLKPLTRRKLTRADTAALERVAQLTPGDFKVVWQRHAFAAPARLSNAGLIDALGEETRARSLPAPTIGFHPDPQA